MWFYFEIVDTQVSGNQFGIWPYYTSLRSTYTILATVVKVGLYNVSEIVCSWTFLPDVFHEAVSCVRPHVQLYGAFPNYGVDNYF